MQVNLDWKLGAVLVLGVYGGMYIVSLKIPEVAQWADTNLNPTKDTNWFNKTFEKIYKALTGSEDNLGEDIYDFFHKKEEDIYPAPELPIDNSFYLT